jgi:tRNA 2-thiocytidine biosynthesis protein TtcA
VQNIKRILSRVRAAIADYGMIQYGDRIAVGLSGGKDSLVLALALKRLSMFLPEKFEMLAICLDLGFDGADFAHIGSFCEQNEIPLHIEKTHIARIVFDLQKPKSACALCSNLRRGALNNAAIALGCNKVALGHHMDDVIQTFYLSMLYEGKLSLFSPITHLTRTGITVIRPMIYVEEHEIATYIKNNRLVPMKNPCNMNGFSRRELVKNILSGLYKVNPAFKNNILNSIMDSEIDGWHKKNRSPGLKK